MRFLHNFGPRSEYARRLNPTTQTKWPCRTTLALIAAIHGVASLHAGQAKAPGWAALGETIALGAGTTPGVGTDWEGNVHVVFMRDGGILHRTHVFGAAALSPEEAVPLPEGPGPYNSPHVVCGANGVVHLVFVHDFAGKSRRSWYAQRRDGKWSAPLLVHDITEEDRRLNYPRLHVAGDTAYVAGFVGGGSAVMKVVGLAGEPRVSGMITTKLWVVHPFVRSDELLLAGRAGSHGHALETYSSNLEPRRPGFVLSRGALMKTGESTAAYMDRAGVIHVAGLTGGGEAIVWYNSDRRAEQEKDLLIGPDVGAWVAEYTYPSMTGDEHGRIFISFRHHTTGEGRLAMVEPQQATFSGAVTFAPEITKRLRWNAPLAAARGGGVWLAWESDGEAFLRFAGVGRPHSH